MITIDSSPPDEISSLFETYEFFSIGVNNLTRTVSHRQFPSHVLAHLLRRIPPRPIPIPLHIRVVVFAPAARLSYGPAARFDAERIESAGRHGDSLLVGDAKLEVEHTAPSLCGGEINVAVPALA